MRRLFIALLFLASLPFASAQDDPLKVAFIYVSPAGDYGFSYAHELARQKVDAHFGDAVETVFVEDVPEPDVEAYIDQLVADGADVIMGTSFGYGDGILAAAQRYPDTIFGWGTGYMRAPNVFTSESGQLGYVAAFPISEVKRHINAFTLGAREVNPDATVDVRWLFNWFDPAGTKEATEAMIAEGVDVIAFTEDTPTAVQTAAEYDVPSFSHYASMVEFSPETVASGHLVNWEVIYIDFLQKVLDGTYTSENLSDVDYFWLLEDDAVELGSEPGVKIAEAFVEPLENVTVDHPELGEVSVVELVMDRHDKMVEGRDVYDPFLGPVVDRNGNEVYEAGYLPTIGDLTTLEWAAPGVVGAWDNEPQ
jgi:simple sugar transport system substrate-binding protein